MSTSGHKNPHYALRIPVSTMDKLKYIADYNERSANKEIEQLILKHIGDFETQNGIINNNMIEETPIRRRTDN